MRWEHEGVAYFAATAPIRQPRANKPHIAITHGRWWASEVGDFLYRAISHRWVENRNQIEQRPEVTI